MFSVSYILPRCDIPPMTLTRLVNILVIFLETAIYLLYILEGKD